MSESKNDRGFAHLLVVGLVLAGIAAGTVLVQQQQFWKSRAAGNAYYIDSVAGSDANSGTSITSPWKSLSKVTSRTYAPGDTINFKAGSSYSGTLTLTSSGSSAAPITIQPYGTGSRPVITAPGTNPKGPDVIKINANYVVVKGLLLRGSAYSGVRVSDGYHHDTIEDNEITGTGLGVMLQGDYNRVVGNNIHDLKMVVNTSTSSTDDYGANGVMLDNSHDDEIASNRFTNNRAPSIDYDYDGGAIEFWGDIYNINVHDNYSSGAEGFLEQGGGDVSNITLARNDSRDYAGFVMLHLDPNHVHGGTATGFVMEANTVIRNLTKGYRVLDIQGSPTSSQVMFKNNLVYSNTSIARDGDHGHVGNKYFLKDGAVLGYSPLGTGETLGDATREDLNTFTYAKYFGTGGSTSPTAGPSAAPTGQTPTTAPVSSVTTSDGVTISNTRVSTGKAYVWDVSLAVGDQQFIDRAFTFSSTSICASSAYLRTANDDKSSTATNFLSFDVNTPVTVMVTHDDRISAKPAWLTTFTRTSSKVVGGSGTSTVYTKNFPAGTVTLGGNAGGQNSMYNVVVKKAPDPTATPVITTINDATMGTALNQFEFVGTWKTATGTGKYNNDDHYSNTANSYYQVRFSGTQIKLYGAKASHHGIAAISVDGGSEVAADFYASTRVENTVIWTSPVLSAGSHTLKVRVKGAKNSSSTGTYITADRVDVTQ